MVATSVGSVETVPSGTSLAARRAVQHLPAIVGYVAGNRGEVISYGRPTFQAATRSACSSESLRVVQRPRIADAAPDQGQGHYGLWRRVYVSHRRCQGCMLQYQ